MRIVLDTNILLVAIGKTSLYRPIWQAFIDSQYHLIITEDIIHEYEEIIQKHSAPGAKDIVLAIFAESPNIIFKRTYYNWNAIISDPDDNKFFDAAIAGNADYLVTNDGHFKDASNINFPKVNIIDANALLEILSGIDVNL